MTPRAASWVLLPSVAIACAALLAGCKRDGCVGGDDGTCEPPSACPAVHYVCAAGVSDALNVSVIGDPGVTRGKGPKAAAAEGDIVLENALVRVVLAAVEHKQGLAPSGGSIIDFAPLNPLAADASNRGDQGDQANGIFQAAGLLPRDAVRYTSSANDKHDSSDPSQSYVSVVFRGSLDADPRVTVVTRYELRACEPGVRVRTDLYNGAPDPNTLYVTDGYFWGDHGMAPFVPGPGLGFRAPEVELTEISTAWREWPFLAARSQAAPDLAYASVPCDRGKAAGFNDPTLSAAGIPLVTTLPGDGVHFERYIIATPGAGLAPAVGEALRVRQMVHGDPAPVTVTGRIVGPGGFIAGAAGPVVSLLFYEPGLGPEPDDPARRVPWSEVVPSVEEGSEGTFSVTLPPNRTYRVQPYAFGRPVAMPTTFAVARDDVNIGDVTVSAAANLLVSVTTAPGQPGPVANTYAELVVVPVVKPSGGDVASFYGLFPGCAPMLGPPHGGSPACNRAVTHNGTFDLLIPPGQYFVYVTRGPFATLKRAQISVEEGDVRQLPFLVESLPLLPKGALSGDFHVHGAASYDSSIPDQDRVVSFLATGLDVVVATDHDVVTTYEDTLTALSATGKITVIPGIEQTPNILWFSVPGEDFPKTLGHFNFWPLVSDRTLPRNGAPWDELKEPGQMMDDIAPLLDLQKDMTGVRQLNHPMIDTKLGRDQGLMTAIGYDVRTTIADGDTFASQFLLRKPGDGHANLDWNVQEVMTGVSPSEWLRYRALWFSMLSQGIVRAGTANSDTHTLSAEHAGYPRNIVFGDPLKPFMVDDFDEDVRLGHIVGTNGPVIQAALTDDPEGNPLPSDRQPGVKAVAITPGVTQLRVSVAAAPWIPLQQIRIYVNGTLIDKLTKDLPKPGNLDPFGSQAVELPPELYKLADLVPEPARGDKLRDAWVVVEVGMTLELPPDRDDDGLPDLAAGEFPAKGDILKDPRFQHYQAIVPGGWPVAFTNPFLLDLDGDGEWQAPGL